MDELAVPVTRLPKAVLVDAMLSESGIQRVLVELVQRHLFTDLSPEDLTALDEPDLVPGSRRMPRAKGKVSDFEKTPRYELRYSDAINMAEVGLIGHTTETNFGRLVEWMYQVELKQLKLEQPNCDWQLVAGTVEQVDYGSSVPIFGDGPDLAAQIRASGGAPRAVNLSNEAPGQNGQVTGFRTVPSVKWIVPLVFADVARAELTDPAAVRGTGNNPVSGLTAYIQTRQLRHMSDGLRANRQQAIRAIREFEARKGKMAEDVARKIPLSRAQLEEARSMRADGIPLARIGQLVGVSPEILEIAFAEIPKEG